MKTLYFITSNKGKLQEATKKLRPLGYAVVQKDLGYPELQTDSLEEVATWGITYIQDRFDEAFMLEDAGLFIDALEGFPGVYSKYVFFTIGLPGILRLLQEADNRKAVFRSVYAYYEPGKKPIIVTGECNGTISQKQQGKNGFGYDPIFIPNGEEKTFGEMTIDKKNKFSHRGRALEKLIAELNTLR
ncbi:MAG TPA: non-canonical purine NTP pyrophosphatase, RdgB/HAM1 family [Thermoplasmata archaeon]|jgi:XTP/dITP diphosphohydrolase|nr:MAG TPA: non-canonical purine NTP pyrophosphatase, RdgB/HAM1 family [Thermoplasmata archaeon]